MRALIAILVLFILSTTHGYAAMDGIGNGTSTPDIASEQQWFQQYFSFSKAISVNRQDINDPAHVQALERFLNAYENESLEVNGIYETSDVEAVKRFQKKHKREILEIWKLDEPTGFVGPTTILKMNQTIRNFRPECPFFVEYSGGPYGDGSAEALKTKMVLEMLGMYTSDRPANNWSDLEESLKLFQTTFHEVTLDPWNIVEPTGYKYKTTNKYLNHLVGCDTSPVELPGIGIYDY